MVKLLHVLATGLEMGIGIWIFSQIFEKRNRMGKRHIVSEILLYMWLILGTYNFSIFYYKANRWNWYLPIFSFVVIFLFGICLFYKIIKKQFGKKENNIIVLALFIGGVLITSCQYWTSYQSYPFTLLGNGAPVLFLFAFFRCTFVQAYLWSFWYYTNLALLKMVYITYIEVFQKQNLAEFFMSTRLHTYSESGYSVIFCLVIWIFIRHIPIQNVLKEVLDDKKKKIFVLTLGEWFILRSLMISGIEKVEQANLTFTLILVIGIIIVLTWVLARTMGMAADNERKFLDSRNRTLEQQYQELNTAYERYRCLVHDEKHMMFYLQECLDNGDIHTAQNFLEGYKESIASGGGGFHTGISTLDFILNVKKRKMDELQAEFALEADIEKIPMEDADFVMLIGNLLDNAIEAVEKCPSEGREIHLTLKNVNEMFFLQVKNSSAELPVVKNSRFFTGKKQKEEHGWGIESVKHIVSKYDGMITFNYDDDSFETTVLIN